VADVEMARLQTLEELAEQDQDSDTDPNDWSEWQLEATTASGALVFRIYLGRIYLGQQ
jgi:hypothetical protein